MAFINLLKKSLAKIAIGFLLLVGLEYFLAGVVIIMPWIFRWLMGVSPAGAQPVLASLLSLSVSLYSLLSPLLGFIFVLPMQLVYLANSTQIGCIDFGSLVYHYIIGCYPHQTLLGHIGILSFVIGLLMLWDGMNQEQDRNLRRGFYPFFVFISFVFAFWNIAYFFWYLGGANASGTMSAISSSVWSIIYFIAYRFSLKS